MSLLDKFDAMTAVRADLAARGLRPFGAINEKIISPTEGTIAGKRVILAGTHNYLGLTFEPECIEAAQRCVAEQGTGTCGSRMAAGTYAEHDALEIELAAFFGRRYGIVFSTGFSACMGVPATLAGPGDTILMDSDSHASIYDGVRLSGAEVVRFRHNDAANLEKRLERLGDKAKDTLVVVEGIYSMLGDMAPLGAIAELKRKYGFCLLVDEAHSMGVLGARGRGLAEAAGVEDDVDFIVGTFSKSLGTIGGYCVSNLDQTDAIRFSTRSYLFTASSTPATIASARAALRVLQARPALRETLWRNANMLYNGLRELGFRVGPDASPVVAAIFEDRETAIRYWQGLLDQGVLVNLVVPPGSPSTYSLLRASASAAHTEEQIRHILSAYANLRLRDAA
jgi:8-amino-7-oxononanoate synthase